MNRRKPNRRWFRFTLRGLMICVLILCVWLAWVVNRAHFQRDLLAALDRCDAVPKFSIEFNEQGEEIEPGQTDFEPSAFANWLAPWIGEEYFYPTIVGARFYEHSPTIEALRLLARLPRVYVLSFSAAGISSEMLDQIKSLPAIERLEITDASDDLLMHVAQLKSLKRLSLQGEFGTFDCLQQLDNLRELDVSSSLLLTVDSLAEIARLRNLEKLGLGALSLDTSLEPLTKLTRLKHITLYDRKSTVWTTLDKLRHALPDLAVVTYQTNGCSETPSVNWQAAQRRERKGDSHKGSSERSSERRAAR
jgi:hypothetical protein